MIRGYSMLALSLLCSAPVMAADKRIQTLSYDPEQIVQIVGREGIQSTIEFGPDERIENVAVGDSSVWQVTPNRRASLLFLKPLSGATRTNMTVVTDRHLYMFDLVATRKAGAPIYALKFDYPNDEKAVVAQPAMHVAEAPPTQPSFSPEQLNFGWRTKGSDRLLPSRIFDDGRALYLAWDREVALPAILTVSNERREGPVNYRTSGNFIVIDPMPSNIVLRQGKRTAVIWPGRALRPAALPPKPVSPPAVVATAQRTPPRTKEARALRMADMNSLYSNNLSGGRDAH